MKTRVFLRIDSCNRPDSLAGPSKDSEPAGPWAMYCLYLYVPALCWQAVKPKTGEGRDEERSPPSLAARPQKSWAGVPGCQIVIPEMFQMEHWQYSLPLNWGWGWSTQELSCAEGGAGYPSVCPCSPHAHVRSQKSRSSWAISAAAVQQVITTNYSYNHP